MIVIVSAVFSSSAMAVSPGAITKRGCRGVNSNPPSCCVHLGCAAPRGGGISFRRWWQPILWRIPPAIFDCFVTMLHPHPSVGVLSLHADVIRCFSGTPDGLSIIFSRSAVESYILLIFTRPELTPSVCPSGAGGIIPRVPHASPTGKCTPPNHVAHGPP
jgi:hypothetical protein